MGILEDLCRAHLRPWLLGLVLLVGWILLAPSDPLLTVAVEDVFFIITSTTAAAYVAHRARLSSEHRRTWGWLAAGMVAWACGEVVWTVNEVVLRPPDLFPSWADLGYLLFPVAASIALLHHPTASLHPGGGLRRVLDGLLAAGAVLLVSWSTVLSAILEAGAESTADLVIWLAYPISDVALLISSILILSRSARSERRSLVALTVGLCLMAIADSGFTWMDATGTYVSAHLIDAGWYVAFAAMAIAAGLDRPATQDRPATSDSDFTVLLLPYLPLVVAIVVLVPQAAGSDHLDSVQIAGVAVISVLVLARQFLTLYGNVRLTQQLRQKEGELLHLAFHDSLTGLANRSLFLNRVEQALERREPELAVLFCDLDNFKVVNDTLGHAAGDVLLTEVAARLRQHLRPEDTLARLGGDEFAVLVEGPVDTAALGARLLGAFDEPFPIAETTVPASVSIGVAVVPRGAEPPDTSHLLALADSAMYQAKRDGKARVSTVRAAPTPRSRR